jgi:hypothetical protein
VSAFLLLFGKFKSVSKSILSRLKTGGVTALVIATALSSALSLSSCSKEERICGELMGEFQRGFGIGGVVYHLKANEGEVGFMREGFISDLLGEGEELISDFAYLSASTPDEVAECTLILCHTEYDAITAVELCRNRINLVDTLTEQPIEGRAFILKQGRYLVMGILPDGKSAESLWRKIL